MKTRSLLQVAAAALAGAATARVATRYAHAIEALRTRYASLRRMVETAAGPIECAVIGDGPPVLVVHGAGGGYDQGLDIGTAVAPGGFRIVAMSRFGYLGTPLPDDASAMAQADAHAALLDALGIARAAIVGVSAGAASSLQFALRHPSRCSALGLIVPGLFVPRAAGHASLLTPEMTELLFDTALRSDFLFWAATRLARRAMIRGILATPPEVVDRASADERARIDQTLQRILPVSPRRIGLLNDARAMSTLTRYALESVAAPTLVASVADDLFGTFDAARYTAEHIPNARFIGFKTGGHLWVGHHDAMIAEVAGFLRANAARSTTSSPSPSP
jgi:pimeloyl-ACP methyl ester carboxylesterase